MGIGFYLQFGFAQHALEAAFLVAVSCGLIGPFVITRTMAFAVHGTSELAFTGAVGRAARRRQPARRRAGRRARRGQRSSALLGQRAAERDSTIGVILAAGLGLGVFLLGYYHGYASEALNILFGNIFGISSGQILLLGVIAVVVAVVPHRHPAAPALRLGRPRRGPGQRRAAPACSGSSSSSSSPSP